MTSTQLRRRLDVHVLRTQCRRYLFGVTAILMRRRFLERKDVDAGEVVDGLDSPEDVRQPPAVLDVPGAYAHFSAG